MSFEIYLQCFDRGAPAGVSRAQLWSLFPVVESAKDVDRWVVQYDERNRCDLHLHPLSTDASLISAVTIARPCADRRLWEALFAVLRLGHVTLYVPGESPPLVATAEAGAQLPAAMVEALGAPRVVASAQAILAAVRIA